ncbi:preprotein translocase subunit SecE [Symbioplanes lichenis]|uniref:preprotein translocase subunit SecE n=1 Tax=Symbioplanes lichenis TaxID=1629072 RepID=UPI002739BC15|nr:preprotein translocase subunit SecE [Actinoplanes lichenis]
MAERNRPGDDAAGERPEDESIDDVTADDARADDGDEELTRGGGTAVRERTDSGKGKATKERRRGRIGGFFREVVGELRKVIWPTRRELLTYTAVVIVFVAVMTTIVALLDYGFGKAILTTFGN